MLHIAKDSFSVSNTILPAVGLGGTSCWEGAEPGHTDLNWPKGSPTLHGSMWQKRENSGELGRGGCCCSGTVWASVCRWWALALCITYCVNIFITVISLFLFSLCKQFIARPMNSIFFSPPILSFVPVEEGEVSTWLCSTECLPGKTATAGSSKRSCTQEPLQQGAWKLTPH